MVDDVCVCVCVHACMRVSVCACVYVFMYVCMHACVCMNVCAVLGVCTHTFMCAGWTVITTALEMVCAAVAMALANVTVDGRGLCVMKRRAQTTALHPRALATWPQACVSVQMHLQVCNLMDVVYMSGVMYCDCVCECV